MAMRYGYFDSEITGVDENGMPIFDRAETSDLFRMFFANLVSNGVLASPGDCFQVVAGTGMTVQIRPGFAMIKGAFAYDADEAIVTLAAANANLPRLDRVVLRCNYHDRCCEIIVKTGTPSTVPVAPELLQPANGDYYELGLALIVVAANQAAITQSSITDTRADSSVCGLITQLIDHIDTSVFMQQLETWMSEYEAQCQDSFGEWFDEMKDQLSEDAAGNLQQQINSLTQSVGADIGQINEIIGDTDMGTTAKTLTGAIKEHEDQIVVTENILNNQMFKTREYSWDNVTIAADWYKMDMYNVTLSGYRAVGIIGFAVYQASSGGVYSNWCIFQRCRIILDGATDKLDYYVWNQNKNAAAKVMIKVRVLYVKSGLVS